MSCQSLDEIGCRVAFPCCTWDSGNCTSLIYPLLASTCDPSTSLSDRWVVSPVAGFIATAAIVALILLLVWIAYELPERRAYRNLTAFDVNSLLVEASQTVRKTSAHKITTDRLSEVAITTVADDRVVYSTLLAVSMDLVQADRARGITTEEIMKELVTGSKYLTTITDEARATTPGAKARRVLLPSCRLAIMSYRIAKADTDEFTLAPAAFESALECALRHDVTHIWLDVRGHVHHPHCMLCAPAPARSFHCSRRIDLSGFKTGMGLS